MSDKSVLKLARVQDLKLEGKKILLRVDFNVPLKDGMVADEKRIVAALPTIRHLLDNKCRIVVISHLGRPKGKVNAEMSLEPVVPVLKKLTGATVHFAKDCIGPEAEQAVESAQNGEIVLLENLRFHPEEEANDKEFAKKLSGYGEIFVQDAFGTVHRAHASTAAIAEFLPGSIGFLIQKELEFLYGAIKNPERPFLAVIGGAKVSDKIKVLNNLLDVVDRLIIGGGMAYTFLAAQGVSVGKSLLESDRIEDAKRIISKAYSRNVECLLPADHIVANQVKNGAKTETTQAMAIGDNWIGVDIGPRTTAMFVEHIKRAKTVFWNGPLGVFEIDAFSKGSVSVAKAMAEATKSGVVTIAGGGDSLAVLKKAKINGNELSHCSTGGGASMEFIEGKILPGLLALSQKQ
jgi:phosphoglycerate kinase